MIPGEGVCITDKGKVAKKSISLKKMVSSSSFNMASGITPAFKISPIQLVSRPIGTTVKPAYGIMIMFDNSPTQVI